MCEQERESRNVAIRERMFYLPFTIWDFDLQVFESIGAART
jgi:hypothetical protein